MEYSNPKLAIEVLSDLQERLSQKYKKRYENNSNYNTSNTTRKKSTNTK
jgi:Uma2 family endonuclease